MSRPVAATSPAVSARASARARPWGLVAGIAFLALAAGLVLLGTAFAGSAGRLASGTRIAGVDVGGLNPADARRLLERRAALLAGSPITFTVGGRRFRLTPRQLDINVDWAGAVASAQRQGGGFAFVRGYRRLALHLFPQDLAPAANAYDAAVEYEVRRIALAVDSQHRDAQLVRRGLKIAVVPGATGYVLDRQAAGDTIVSALAGFSRARVALPVRSDPPAVTAASLAGAARAARLVLSAPVTVAVGETRWRLPRWRLAGMLDLPRDARSGVRIGGPQADSELARLQKEVGRAPQDAGWAVTAGGGIRVVPDRDGLVLDAAQSASRILAAAERPANRVAHLVVVPQAPSRTTAEATAMGITGTVGTYETIYGGIANRIHNVQLVAHLVDTKLIAPGATFSFNGATGERSAAKGFLEAPVIINGELSTGLGGGVCQVSTTVFNAAYEAGLPITDRTNHALYISHYPLGRDATVDYPSVDLKFVNDTPHWLLLRTFVGSDSLVVTLYGSPQHRRVVTDTAPLTVVAPPPVQRTRDASLAPGEVVVDDPGVPAQTTSVRRRVYAANGKLLSDETWVSNYRAEPKLVRIGPKKKKTPAVPGLLMPGSTTPIPKTPPPLQ